MGPRAGLDGCGKSRPPPPPAGIRSPDRPAHSKSLYRLSYPDPHKLEYTYQLRFSDPAAYNKRGDGVADSIENGNSLTEVAVYLHSF